MKRFVLLFFIIIFHLYASGQTNAWVGGPSGTWSSGSNWSLNHPPTASEDVEISYTCNINVTAFSGGYIDINSLRITGPSDTVTLSCPDPAIRHLRMSSTSPTTRGLTVEAGNTLIFDVTNFAGTATWICDLTGANGVTGLVDGTLRFDGTGSATSATGLNVYTSPTENARLVVSSTGTILYAYRAGNTNSVPGPYLTMQNGSTYRISNSNGIFPPAIWEPNSLAKAACIGPTAPGFTDGVVYGNMEWNCPMQSDNDLNGSVTFNNVHFISTHGSYFRITGASGGNRTMTIDGNLVMDAGSNIDIVGALAPAGSSGKLLLKGHLTNLGLINTNGVYGTINQFELGGSSNQNITITPGSVQGTRLELVMNGDSATLMNPFILFSDSNATGANLQLIKGKIITTSANYLRLNHTATVSGGSDLSFVSGPMRKLGNDDFIFPVGKGSIYAPIGIYNVGGGGELATDIFIAEYIRSNPQSTYGSSLDPFLNHVSFVEYWTLRQSSGSAFKRVSLEVNLTSFCMNLSKTYVSHRTSLWTYEATAITAGPVIVGLNQTGTIRATTLFLVTGASAHAFTLATDLPFASNPLPIDLISFDASKISNTKASVNWELGAVCSPSAKFEIQRADANKNFSSIATVNGSATDRFYSYPDNDLKKGINYYRLKMIDENGKISYSRTVAIMNGINGVMLTSLIPTVVNHSAMLTIASSGRQQLDLVIVDMQGRIVQKQNHTVVAGNTNILLTTDRLSAGIYQLIGITPEGKTNMIRFVRQ